MTQSFEDISRQQVKALDKILGKPFKVLDNGFIRVIDYMGSDSAIVQAARVSYGTGTTKIRQDRLLLRYLMRHQHTSPFEMCEIKLHIRAPMDCWRQWIRHRTANINEYSTRYSIAIDASQTTPSNAWRLQAKRNIQGSEGLLDKKQGLRFTAEEKELQDAARKVYNDRIEAGIAREQARKDLPLSTYTEAYWKIDLNNLLNFLHLRMDEKAQAEIRAYAKVIGEKIVARWCPLVWEAFQDYVINGMKLSLAEQQLLAALASNASKSVDLAKKMGWLEKKDGKLKLNYERTEFEDKCAKMGIKVPWKKDLLKG